MYYDAGSRPPQVDRAIGSGLGKGSQHTLNEEIAAFIVNKDARREAYSVDDIAYINTYEGAGGQGSQGATGEGLLYEFFTPDYICELMWELAYHHGYDGGNVLEPAMGTGRLIKPAKDYSRCIGFEINPVSARIAAITCPGLTVYNGYFETAFLQNPRFTTRYKGDLSGIYARQGNARMDKMRTERLKEEKKLANKTKGVARPTWLAQYPFSLCIGNPPYGIYKNKYSSFFPEGKRVKQIEIFFMLMGLKMLKPGGLLVYITSSNFMRNGDSYRSAKLEIAEIADFVDAYRLPPVFANSKVPTDILIFRRK